VNTCSVYTDSVPVTHELVDLHKWLFHGASCHVHGREVHEHSATPALQNHDSGLLKSEQTRCQAHYTDPAEG
jgi:hypothetical protein